MSFYSRFPVASRAMMGLVLVGASGGFLCAESTVLVEPPAPLLPAQVDDWVKTQPPEGAAQSLGADGQVLNEDGLKRFERGVYHSTANPSSTVTVTAYQFGDATGAHAAYSYYLRQGSSDRVAKIGDETTLAGTSYLFRTGTSIVSAQASGRSAEAFLSGLEGHLPKVGGPKGLPPLLPTYLPSKGLQTDTVKYAVGPVSYQATGGVLPGEIVGFDKAAETVTAKYAGQGTLTLLLYPTPQIAAEHGRAIEAEMHREGPPAGTVMLRREGPMVLLTTGRWTADEAQRMVEGIHLRSDLTWNKQMPLEFHSEVQKTFSLLTSIAVFCGLGALAAIVLGLFFGGARAAIRVLQGKPAATEPEFLRIDLSGQAARIHPDGPGAGSGA